MHIDLGIAFDKGLLLKTPECVPFRLTRDIEDGLGVSGVEGVLTGCMEQTMRVLRDNSEALITILEVMLRNPLYNWSLEQATATEDGGVATNRGAERALVRIEDKLRGIMRKREPLSYKGQVGALLREARSGENLCQMFDGWAAWL